MKNKYLLHNQWTVFTITYKASCFVCDSMKSLIVVVAVPFVGQGAQIEW